MYKYQGAGNDFIIIDDRDGNTQLTPAQVAKLCDRHYGIGADGLMLLQTAPEPYGFHMVYYNSDGSTGMMCGNGARCIVAFAHFLGITNLRFTASDGPHIAEILSSNGTEDIVRIRLRDVDEIINYELDFSVTSSSDFSQSTSVVTASFLDTGTRHLVVPVQDIEHYDVYGVGETLRYNDAFAPIGTNVNFIEHKDGVLHVRTYEKGVENETCACGTGITAAAIAYWHAIVASMAGNEPDNYIECAKQHGIIIEGLIVRIPIRALHDSLSVDFIPTSTGATDVHLTGPATRVARILPTMETRL